MSARSHAPSTLDLRTTPASLAEILDGIDRRLARLESTAGRIESAAASTPAGMAALVDTLDDVAAGLAARGVDLHQRLRDSVTVLDRLTQPAAIAAAMAMLDRLGEIRTLVQSGMLAPSTVNVLAELGRALSGASERPVPEVGLVGTLRALGAPDVRRAVGYGLAVARRLGAALAGDEPAAVTDGRTR